VLDELSSGTDVDMPCQGLLSTFFLRQQNRPAVGSSTKRRLRQNQIKFQNRLNSSRKFFFNLRLIYRPTVCGVEQFG